MTSIRLAHPTGAPFARHAAKSLHDRRILDSAITCLLHRENSPLDRVISFLPGRFRDRVRGDLLRRSWLDPEIKVELDPWRELIRLSLIRSGMQKYSGFSYRQLVDWVYCGIDSALVKSIKKSSPSAIYAYEDGAAESFSTAKQLGVRRIYDLPIVHYKTSFKIQNEEAERFPELAPALSAAHEPAWKLERKDRELELAEKVIVASTVTEESLLNSGVSKSKISVVPYGVDLQRFTPGRPESGTFRVLFVGRVGPRKGVHYLLDAWKSLNLPNAELLLVGINEFPEKWWRKAAQIPGVRHIDSIPQHELVSYYQRSHVLAFPSLVEGFGMVILEALACGTPVLTTARTAGIDLLTENKDGWIVPPCDKESIMEHLENMYRNPEMLIELRTNARATAERFSWAPYRELLSNSVCGFLANE